MKKLTLLIIVFFFALINAMAQENVNERPQQNGKWVMHVGAVFPGEDFANDDIDSEKALAASIGVGLNLEYIYPLNEKGLGLFFGIGLNFNWLKSDFKDEIIKELKYYADEDDITFMKYFTAPISAGLNYTYETNEKVSLYGNFGLVANLMKVTNFEVETFNNGISVQNFDISSNLGFNPSCS